jgi:hypothetical protein
MASVEVRLWPDSAVSSIRRHGSYLGISCRHLGRRTTAEDDPQQTLADPVISVDAPCVKQSSAADGMSLPLKKKDLRHGDLLTWTGRAHGEAPGRLRAGGAHPKNICFSRAACPRHQWRLPGVNFPSGYISA